MLRKPQGQNARDFGFMVEAGGVPFECFLDPPARLEPGARWVNSYTD
jgi:hypothetical protein